MLTVHAMDDDGAAFTFSLTATGQFSIDAASGEVVVAMSPTPPLDREVHTYIVGKKDWTKFAELMQEALWTNQGL